MIEEIKNLIEIKELTKVYENQNKKEILFENLSFEIKKSEIFVILGKSGSGKSTLLNILSKLDSEYSGSIIYDKDLYIGINTPFPVVFQEFDQLLPWYTVKKNIILPLKTKDISTYVMDIINFLGLEKDLDKYPSTLSGGMKQRVAIARALICDSSIIFMDEPFGSLDFIMRKNLQSLIKDINIKYSKTIVFITHDIEEAVFIGDRVLLYKDNNDIEIIEINKNIDQSKMDMIEHIKNQLIL